MTVEVKIEETQVGGGETVIPQEDPKKIVEENIKDAAAVVPKTVQKSSSYKEESNFLSDLKDFEKKALADLKSKLEEAIIRNNLFEKPAESKKTDKPLKEEEKQEEETKKQENQEEEKEEETKKQENQEEEKEEETKKQECQEEEEEKKPEVVEEEEVNKNISLWGISLLGSKGEEGTDVVLLKFLRARDFKVNDAFQMLKKTLQWRKESNIDSILEQDLEVDFLSSAFYMNGVDREGHPVCYNIYGAFSDQELYSKAFGNEEKRKQFLKWRVQLMEKGIQKLQLKPGGVTSMLQISDLKNSPAPSKKELRTAMNQAVSLLQDNYPEFVSKNIFVNVPFWYYALNALLSPFLTQRSKSKFVVARPAKVTETLLKYIPLEEIPVEYGGFKREKDFEFSAEDGVASEIVIKAGGTQNIDIPAIEVGGTMLWDVSVVGGEVNYKEEFVPSDEGSYTVIISKPNKINSALRNTFRNNEAGKIVLTIHNNSTKKKRLFYRYKAKKTAACF